LASGTEVFIRDKRTSVAINRAFAFQKKKIDLGRAQNAAGQSESDRAVLADLPRVQGIERRSIDWVKDDKSP
jgi:hypothetical protein